VTIAKFENEAELKEEMEKLKKEWKPISFEVKEIHMLARVGGNIFEIMHAIPLGSSVEKLREHYVTMDINSGFTGGIQNDIPDSSFGKSVVVCNLPEDGTEDDIKAILSPYSVVKAEVLKNPNGSKRRCGVAELSSIDDVSKLISSKYAPRELLGYAGGGGGTGNGSGTGIAEEGEKPEGNDTASKPYVIHLPKAAFPCVGVGDCCSLDAVLANPLSKWANQ